MAEEKKEKKSEHSFVADQQNWEQRVKTELESGKKWNENWGTLFGGGVPNDYTERVKFLEGELKKENESGYNGQTRYGVGPAFKEVTVGRQDFRRKKMFAQPTADDV